jgi:hypothetical protein
MIELVVIVVAGLVILGVVTEIFQRLDRRDTQRYEARSKARLLDELRRQR